MILLLLLSVPRTILEVGRITLKNIHSKHLGKVYLLSGPMTLYRCLSYYFPHLTFTSIYLFNILMFIVFNYFLFSKNKFIDLLYILATISPYSSSPSSSPQIPHLFIFMKELYLPEYYHTFLGYMLTVEFQ